MCAVGPVGDIGRSTAAVVRSSLGPPTPPTRMNALDIKLDPDHPTPLYHQIAMAIRWKIGTGVVTPGELLPPLRTASEAWDVSYHTVRRAYAELARAGLVQSRRGDGTRVVETAIPAQGSDVRDGVIGEHVGAGEPSDPGVFVRRLLMEARRRYDLSGAELGRLVERVVEEMSTAPEAADSPFPSDTEGRVALVECNDHQATELARQLQGRWGVQATPWNLSWQSEPPPGPIIGTRFHQGEMLERWPDRAADMCFAALRIDPRTVEEVRQGLRTQQNLVLVELDVGTGHQHLEDLMESLGTAAQTSVRMVLPDLEALTSSADLYVIAPRLVDQVPDEIRRHPRVVILQHVFEPADLEALGELRTGRV